MQDAQPIFSVVQCVLLSVLLTFSAPSVAKQQDANSISKTLSKTGFSPDRLADRHLPSSQINHLTIQQDVKDGVL